MAKNKIEVIIGGAIYALQGEVDECLLKPGGGRGSMRAEDGGSYMLSDYLKYKTPPDSEMSKCKMIWPLYPRKYGMRVGVYKSSSVHMCPWA